MNKTHNQSVQTNPTAYITVRKGRVKIYDKEKQPSKIYLQGGQEFEVELFNPTTSHQLAIIEINGKLISDTGIALKPGQRVYLERYLDVAKKFKFDTYDVESGNASVEKAIVLNGNIKIKFYAETLKTNLNVSNGSFGRFNKKRVDEKWSPVIDTTTIAPLNLTGTITIPTNTNTISWDSINFNSATTNINSTSTNYDWTNNCTFTTNSTINVDSNLSDFNLNSTIDYSPDKKSLDIESESPTKEDVKMKETGRVEQGSSSSQSFEYIDMDFSTLANTTIEYQILPLSEKIVEAKDLKNYCTECGRGLKPEFKFCPSCGTKN